MSGMKSKAQGAKTHEQQLRALERKDDLPKASDVAIGATPVTEPPRDRDARQSEFSVSRGGMHQESRDHNKHNHPGQTGHKPQKHGPDEEKH